MTFMDSWVETTALSGGCPDLRPAAIPFERAVVAVAEAVDGLSAARAADFARFMVYPGSQSNPRMVRDVEHMSVCALTVSALWRCLGVAAPRLWAAYRIGKAVADVVAVAREEGAWLVPPEWSESVPPFRVGDAVLVASPEHVFTVLSVPEFQEKTHTWTFRALHGGSGGKTQVKIDGATEVHLSDNRYSLGGRQVRGIARLESIPLLRAALLPPGWAA